MAKSRCEQWSWNKHMEIDGTVINPKTLRAINVGGATYDKWESRCGGAPAEKRAQKSGRITEMLSDCRTLVKEVLSLPAERRRMLSVRNVAPELISTAASRPVRTHCREVEQVKDLDAIATQLITEVLMQTAEARLLLVKTMVAVYEHVSAHMASKDPSLKFNIVFKGGNVYRMVIRDFWEQMHKNVRGHIEHSEEYGSMTNMSDMDFQTYPLGDCTEEGLYAINLVNYMIMLRLQRHVGYHVDDFLPGVHELDRTDLLEEVVGPVGSAKRPKAKAVRRKLRELSERNVGESRSQCEKFVQQACDALPKGHPYHGIAVLYVGRNNPDPKLFRSACEASALKRKSFVIVDSDEQEGFAHMSMDGLRRHMGAAKESSVEDLLRRTDEYPDFYSSHNAGVKIPEMGAHFNLNRIKMSLVVCYMTPAGEFRSDPFVGELVDLSNSLPDDKKFLRIAEGDWGLHFRRYTVSAPHQYIHEVDGNPRVEFETYTVRTLADDIARILFTDTDNRPWNAGKMVKRLKRYIWCIVIDMVKGSSVKEAAAVVQRLERAAQAVFRSKGLPRALRDNPLLGHLTAVAEVAKEDQTDPSRYDDFVAKVSGHLQKIHWTILVNGIAQSQQRFNASPRLQLSSLRLNSD